MSLNNKRLLKTFKGSSWVAAIVGCLLLLLCGCESLPEGEPPEGPIVTPQQPSSTMGTINQAVNYMTTSLSTIAIQNELRGVKVLKTFSDIYSNRVFRQVADISGIIAVTGSSKPELLLTSKFIRRSKKMLWIMQLIRLSDNEIIWNGKTIINTSTP